MLTSLLWLATAILLPSHYLNTQAKDIGDEFLLLDEANYAAEISKHSSIFVIALSRNCLLCYEQLPIYEQLKREVRRLRVKVVLAKYIASPLQDSFVHEYNITSTPYFILKKDSQIFHASHFQSSTHIMDFILSNLYPAFIDLNSIEEFYSAAKHNVVSMIYFEPDIADSSAFDYLASLKGQHPFLFVYNSKSDTIAQHLNCSASHVYIKFNALPEGRCLPISKHNDIKGLLALYEFEGEHYLSLKLIKKAHRLSQPLFVYVTRNLTDTQRVAELMKFYQGYFGSKFIFCIAPASDREAWRILYYYRIHDAANEFFLIHTTKLFNGKKFVVKFNSDFNDVKSLDTFHDDVIHERFGQISEKGLSRKKYIECP